MPNSNSNSSQAAEVSKSTEDVLAEEEARANAEVQETGKTPGEETPESESAPEKTPQTEGEEEGAKKEEEPEEDVDLSQLSAKAQKRFQKLSEKAKKAEILEKENAELKKIKPALPDLDLTPPSDQKKDQQTGGKLPWEQEETPEGPREITQEEYQQDVAKKAREVVQEELKKNKEVQENEQIFQTFQSDVQQVETDFPALRPPKVDPNTQEVIEENPDFDQNLVLQIAGWYKQMFASNKRLRFYDYVKQVMDLMEKGAEKGKQQVTASVAKQAAEQAISPSGAPSSKGKNLEDLIKNAKTPEELADLEKQLPHAE